MTKIRKAIGKTEKTHNHERVKDPKSFNTTKRIWMIKTVIKEKNTKIASKIWKLINIFLILLLFKNRLVHF